MNYLYIHFIRQIKIKIYKINDFNFELYLRSKIDKIYDTLNI